MIERANVACLLAAKIVLYQYNALIHTAKNPQNRPLFLMAVKRGGETG